VSVAGDLAYEFYASPEALCRAGLIVKIRRRSVSSHSPSSDSEPQDLCLSGSPHENEQSPVHDIKNSAHVQCSFPEVPGLSHLKVNSDSAQTSSRPAARRRRRSGALREIASSLRSMCQLNELRPSAPSSPAGASFRPVSLTDATSRLTHKQRRVIAYKLAHPEKFPPSSVVPTPFPKTTTRELPPSSVGSNKSRGSSSSSFTPPLCVGKSPLSVGSLASPAPRAVNDPVKDIVEGLPFQKTAGFTLCTRCGASCAIRPQYLHVDGDGNISTAKNTPACPCFDAEVIADKKLARSLIRLPLDERVEASISADGRAFSTPYRGSSSSVKPKERKTVSEKKVASKKKPSQEVELSPALPSNEKCCKYHWPHQWKCDRHRKKFNKNQISKLKCEW